MTQAHLHNVMNIDRTKHTHVTSLILSYTCGTMVLPVYYLSPPGHMKIRRATHFLKFCLHFLEILTEIFEILTSENPLFICILLLFLSLDYIEIFLGSRNLVQIFFSDQLLVKIISAQSKLFRLCSTAHQVELYTQDC